MKTRRTHKGGIGEVEGYDPISEDLFEVVSRGLN